MDYVGQPKRLRNLALEEVGKYVSSFMRDLIMNPSQGLGRDLRHHHYQDPCKRLENALKDPGGRLEKYFQNPCSCLQEFLIDPCPCLENYHASPCKRFEENLRRPCKCLNEYLKDPCDSMSTYLNSPRIRFGIFQMRPCKCFKKYLKEYTLDNMAEMVAVVVARHVNNTYNELMTTLDFQELAREVAPEVLKSVLAPFTKKLESFDASDHPHVIDYHKMRTTDLIFRSLPVLEQFRTLRIGSTRRTYGKLNFAGFGETLEVFSSRTCSDSDIESLSEHCRRLKTLDVSHSSQVTDSVVESILKLECLEELILYDTSARFGAGGLTRLLNGLTELETDMDTYFDAKCDYDKEFDALEYEDTLSQMESEVVEEEGSQIEKSDSGSYITGNYDITQEKEKDFGSFEELDSFIVPGTRVENINEAAYTREITAEDTNSRRERKAPSDIEMPDDDVSYSQNTSGLDNRKTHLLGEVINSQVKHEDVMEEEKTTSQSDDSKDNSILVDVKEENLLYLKSFLATPEENSSSGTSSVDTTDINVVFSFTHDFYIEEIMDLEDVASPASTLLRQTSLPEPDFTDNTKSNESGDNNYTTCADVEDNLEHHHKSLLTTIQEEASDPGIKTIGTANTNTDPSFTRNLNIDQNITQIQTLRENKNLEKNIESCVSPVDARVSAEENISKNTESEDDNSGPLIVEEATTGDYFSPSQRDAERRFLPTIEEETSDTDNIIEPDTDVSISKDFDIKNDISQNKTLLDQDKKTNIKLMDIVSLPGTSSQVLKQPFTDEDLLQNRESDDDVFVSESYVTTEDITESRGRRTIEFPNTEIAGIDNTADIGARFSQHLNIEDRFPQTQVSEDDDDDDDKKLDDTATVSSMQVSFPRSTHQSLKHSSDEDTVLHSNESVDYRNLSVVSKISAKNKSSPSDKHCQKKSITTIEGELEISFIDDIVDININSSFTNDLRIEESISNTQLVENNDLEISENLNVASDISVTETNPDDLKTSIAEENISQTEESDNNDITEVTAKVSVSYIQEQHKEKCEEKDSDIKLTDIDEPAVENRGVQSSRTEEHITEVVDTFDEGDQSHTSEIVLEDDQYELANIQEKSSQILSLGSGMFTCEDASTSQKISTDDFEDSRTSTIFARRSERFKTFGCNNATVEHIAILVKHFPNITTILLSNVGNISLTPLKELKHLTNICLKKSDFQVIEELLQEIGTQLNCLNIKDVSGTRLEYIAQRCSFLQCLHLCFQKQSHLILPKKNWISFAPLLESVQRLHLQVYHKEFAETILSGFRNLRKIFITCVHGDDELLDILLGRKLMPHLEEIFWDKEVAVKFSENSADIFEFFSLGLTKEYSLKYDQ